MRTEANWSDESKSWSPNKNPSESQFVFDVSVISPNKQQGPNESAILDGQILQLLKDVDDEAEPPNSSRARRNQRQKSSNTSHRSKIDSTSKDNKRKKSLSKTKNPVPGSSYKMNTFESLSHRLNGAGPKELLENVTISKFAPGNRKESFNTPDPKSRLLTTQLQSDSNSNIKKQTEREKLMQSRHGHQGGAFGTHKKSAISSAFCTKIEMILPKEGQSESDDSPIKQVTIERDGGFLDSVVNNDPNHLQSYNYKGSSADTSSSFKIGGVEEIESEVGTANPSGQLKVPSIALNGINKPFSSSSSINTLSKQSNKVPTRDKQPVKLQKVLGSGSGLDSHDSSPKDRKKDDLAMAPVDAVEKPVQKPLKKEPSRDNLPTAAKATKPDRHMSSDKDTRPGVGLIKKSSSKNGLEPAQPNTKRGSFNQQSNRHFPSIQEVLLVTPGSKD